MNSYIKYKLMKEAEEKIDLRENENKYEENPFLFQLDGKMFLQPRANTIIARGQAIVDTNTGEILKDERVLLGKRKLVDKSQFAKIYASEIGILYELSKAAQTVFLFLTKNMDYDNKSYINAERDCKKLGYNTGKTILKGLKELIKNDIIAPHIISGFYWLNPTIVCKGERFAKYTEYIVADPDEIIEEDALLKKQGKKTFDKLPEKIKNKIQKSNSATLLDSNNKEITLFDDLKTNNPYNN